MENPYLSLPKAENPEGAAAGPATGSNPYLSLRRAEEPRQRPTRAPAGAFADKVRLYAQKHGIPEDVFDALIRQESGYNPRATSKKGAMGLGQLMPGTAKDLGVSDPYDPDQNLDGAARYFSSMLRRYKGNVRLALAAYNAGPGNVDKYGGIPPFEETRNYVARITGGLGQGEGSVPRGGTPGHQAGMAGKRPPRRRMTDPKVSAAVRADYNLKSRMLAEVDEKIRSVKDTRLAVSATEGANPLLAGAGDAIDRQLEDLRIQRQTLFRELARMEGRKPGQAAPADPSPARAQRDPFASLPFDRKAWEAFNNDPAARAVRLKNGKTMSADRALERAAAAGIEARGTQAPTLAEERQAVADYGRTGGASTFRTPSPNRGKNPVETIARRAGDAYESATNLTREDAPYAYAAIDFLANLAGSPLTGMSSAATVLEDPAKAARDLPRLAGEFVQSVNVLDPGISGPERFSRGLNALFVAIGAKAGFDGLRRVARDPAFTFGLAREAGVSNDAAIRLTEDALTAAEKGSLRNTPDGLPSNIEGVSFRRPGAGRPLPDLPAEGERPAVNAQPPVTSAERPTSPTASVAQPAASKLTSLDSAMDGGAPDPRIQPGYRISGDELRKPVAAIDAAPFEYENVSIPNRRKEVFEKLKGLFRDKRVMNEDAPVEFHVSMKTLRHSLRGEFKAEHGAVLANVDDVLKKAVLVETHIDKRGNPAFGGTHRFFAAVRVGEDVYPVKITANILADKGGKVKAYDVETLEVLKPAAKAQALSQTPMQPTSSNLSIGELLKDQTFPSDKVTPIVPKAPEGGGRMTDARGPRQTSETPRQNDSSLQTLDAAPSSLPAQRIQVSPLPGGKRKLLSEISADLSRGLDRKIVRAKTRPGAGGTYYPGSARTTIRFAGDLDTTAHEVAHSLDDKHGLVAQWVNDDASPFDAELEAFWRSPASSASDSGPRSSMVYKRAEGVAEWIRAYLVNPDAAKAAAPQFHAHYIRTVPAKVRQTMDAFSRDIREWAGLPDSEKILANVRMEERGAGGLLADLAAKTKTEGVGFKTTLLNRVQRRLFDELDPFVRAVRQAREVGGKPSSLPKDDPVLLARLHAGVDAKVRTMMTDGLVDAELKPLVDSKTGRRKNQEWLLETLAGETPEATARNIERANSMMIAQRTLELRDRWMRRAEDAADKRAEELIKRADDQLLAAEKQIQKKWDAEGRKIEAVADTKMRAQIAKIARDDPKRDSKVKAARTRRNTAVAKGWADAKAGAKAEAAKLQKKVDEWLDRNLSRDRERLVAAAKRQASRSTGAGAGIVDDTLVAERALKEFGADPEFKAKADEYARRYRSWADDVLDYAQKSGRFSAEQVAAIKSENRYYISLNRYFDDEAGGALGGKLGSSKDVVKKIQGSTREIDNPLRSLMDQTYRVVRESDRNRVMLAFRELLVSARGMYDGAVKELADIGSVAKAGDDQTVKIFVDGKLEHWQFDRTVYDAIAGFADQYSPSVVEKALQVLPRLLRNMITHSPDFLVRNMIRDVTDRSIKSETGSRPWDSFRNIRKEDLRAFEAAGGDQSGWYERAREGYGSSLRQAIGDISKRGDRNILLPLTKSVDWYKELARRSELKGRMAEYRSAYKKAVSTGEGGLAYDDYNAMLYAAGEARGIMDFAQGGTYLKFLNRYIPFANASVQGLRRMAIAARGNPKGFLGRFLLYSAIPEIATYLWNSTDKETLEEYRQQPAYIRDLFWSFKIPEVGWIRIPKGFEVAVLSSGLSRALDRALGNENAFDGYGSSALRAVAPVDESQLMAGVFAPEIELMTNYNFFRGSTTISPWENDLKLELRDTSKASRVGQAIQTLTEPFGGIDARKADAWIRARFGGAGRIGMDLSNIGREQTGTAAAKWLNNATGLFVSTPTFAAVDVQWVMKEARSVGVRGNVLKPYLDRLKEAKNAEEYERFARDLRQAATRIRKDAELAIKRNPKEKNEILKALLKD